MSLIIAVTFKDFAVIVSDGLLVVIEDERTVVPINDQYCKFSIVGDCNIVVGSTGSKLLNRKIREFCEELAEQHRDDPELFSLLERAAPDELQRLKVLFPTDIEYIDDGKKVNFGGANLFLTGYDASQKRMRCISWVDDCKDVCCQGKNVGYQPHNHVGG